MKALPSFSSYGRYSSDNYGVNTLKFQINDVTLYYSYETIVAFCTPEDGLVVHENIWSVTTGKHLNWIDGGRKERRVGDLEFSLRLEKALDGR